MIGIHDVGREIPTAQESVTRLEQLKQLYEDPSFTVGWGTLALLNAGVAQGKNRSGLAWFLLSLLLGPLATFCLVAFCDKLPTE